MTLIKQPKPEGTHKKKFEVYKGCEIHTYVGIETHMKMGGLMFTYNPKNYYYVRTPDGLWLYNQGDKPDEYLMFSAPRYAHRAIDLYLTGVRKFEESQF